jgi:hypothetical protein
MLLALAVIPSLLGCGGSTSASSDSDAGDDAAPAEAGPGIGDGGPQADGSAPTDGGPQPDSAPPSEGGPQDGAADVVVPPPAPTGKLDLLFMVDNSESMRDKQALFGAAVPDLISRLANPNCVDAQGKVVGVSQNAQCAQGKIEFQPVHDIHIGIVTSSLGGRGGDQCPASATNPANPALNSHNDDKGHLIDRAGADEHTIASALPSNFLSWAPGGSEPSAQALTSDFQAMVSGVHEHGCGFEAQLEGWYRFLVQPDPYDQIVVTSNHAAYQGIDAVLLQQRHDFLRPDSAVAVIVVTDGGEEVADPMAVGAQGWAFMDGTFPGSPTGSAPEGTIECQSNPFDPNCTSCAFLQMPDPQRCPTPDGGLKGYLPQADDSLNLRFFHPKQRFGLDVEYPVTRYSLGLTSDHVPDSAHEHDHNGNYTPVANCTNPLFAASLPTSTSQELCNLPRGPRAASQVFYATIAGVPHQLLQADPSNPDSPQKPALDAADWTKILGNDPLHYDFTGADFHMLESSAARTQSPCQPGSADNCDPINGREYDAQQQDLQFACIFDLPAPTDCSLPQYQSACDCTSGWVGQNSPLCQQGAGGAHTQVQIKAAAYPSIRELAVARALGSQAVVSSACPIHTSEKSAGDPLYGYRPAMTALIDRLAPVLTK